MNSVLRTAKLFGICASASLLGLALTGPSHTAYAGETAAANDFNASFGGTYAGTFICSAGEMGMTLSIMDVGPATPDLLGESCKSGAGPCNDRLNERLATMRAIGGVLNFFPTSGNPDAPAGAFRVSGAAEYITDDAAEISLDPGAWIDQPSGFGSSAMTATVFDGEMSGKPTAPGCHTLKLRRIKEG